MIPPRVLFSCDYHEYNKHLLQRSVLLTGGPIYVFHFNTYFFVFTRLHLDRFRQVHVKPQRILFDFAQKHRILWGRNKTHFRLILIPSFGRAFWSNLFRLETFNIMRTTFVENSLKDFFDCSYFILFFYDYIVLNRKFS